MKGAKYLLCVAIYLFQDICHATTTIDNKIVGGENTTIEEHPELAFLLVKKNYRNSICGGSILDEKTILTAAHCLDGVDEIKVKVGVTNIRSKEDDDSYISVESTLAHPDFNTHIYEYDVGILKLSKNLPLDGITTKAMSLVDAGTDVLDGSEIVVCGWGSTSEEDPNSSGNLRTVTVNIVPRDECRKTYPFLRDTMICAGLKEGKKDACQGDSGGPAVLKRSGKQVGIVSFGMSCGHPNEPGVYVNLSDNKINKWINDNRN